MSNNINSSKKIEDKLDRIDTIKSLTKGLIAGEYRDGFVIGIDSGWGKGKTTFLKLWAQHLNEQKEDYNIVSFNAWENDNSDNPLLSLILQLKPFLQENDEENNIEVFSKIVIKGGKRLSNVQHFTSFVEDFNDITEKSSDSIFDDEEERIARAKQFKRAVNCISSKKKLIFFIDELDRCRPSYAIELLENIKHLFNVKDCIFVIAWDKSQLSHAIKTIYGSEMDSVGYLRRFIDIDYKLPDPSRIKYTQTMLPKATTKYSNYFYDLLLAVIDVHKLTLRDIDKLSTYLKINLNIISDDTLNNLPEFQKFFYSLLKAIFLVLRFKDNDLYTKLIHNDKYTYDNLVTLTERLKILEIQDKYKVENDKFWYFQDLNKIPDPEDTEDIIHDINHKPLPYLLAIFLKYQQDPTLKNVYEVFEYNTNDINSNIINTKPTTVDMSVMFKNTNDIFSKIDFWNDIE